MAGKPKKTIPKVRQKIPRTNFGKELALRVFKSFTDRSFMYAPRLMLRRFELGERPSMVISGTLNDIDGYCVESVVKYMHLVYDDPINAEFYQNSLNYFRRIIRIIRRPETIVPN